MAAYLIIRAVLRVLVEIIEITATIVAGMFVAALVVAAVVAVVRWRRQHVKPVGRQPVITYRLHAPDRSQMPEPARSMPTHRLQPVFVVAGKSDAADLFAKAITSGADRRFIDAIVRNALDEGEQGRQR